MGAGARLTGTSQGAAAALLGLVIFVQLTAIGADTGLLAAAAACLNIGVAGLVVLLVGPPARFWVHAAPVLLLLAAALMWAILPDVAGGTHLAALDSTMAPRLAPDLLGSEVTRYFGFAAALLLGALVGHRRGLMRTAVGWILALAALNLAIGLVLRQINPHEVWGIPRAVGGDRFSGTLLNVNAAACAFGAIALLAAGKWLELRKDGGEGGARRGLSGLTAVLVVASAGACVISASRTTTALVVLGLILTFAFEWLGARGRGRWTALLMAVLAVAGVALVLYFAGEILQQRAAALGDDAAYRTGIWSRFWMLANQSPWFGYGLGAFSDLNLHYLRSPAEAAEFWYINDAHNSVLQLLLEGGWPYLLLLTAAIGVAMWKVLITRRRHSRDPLLRGTVLALLLMLGCAMTDIALSVPAIITFASALLGMAWGRAIRIRLDREAGG